MQYKAFAIVDFCVNSDLLGWVTMGKNRHDQMDNQNDQARRRYAFKCLYSTADQSKEHHQCDKDRYDFYCNLSLS